MTANAYFVKTNLEFRILELFQFYCRKIELIINKSYMFASFYVFTQTDKQMKEYWN